MKDLHTKKLFPLQLPQNYHGTLEAKPSLYQLAKSKKRQRTLQNLQQFSPKKIADWQKKRFDTDIINQRKQFLVHPAKISEENPEWLKNTYDYYRRNQFQPSKRQTRAQWESYNVFGRPKEIIYAQTPNKKTRFSSQLQISDKVGSQNRWRSNILKQVTPKIGSIDIRDLRIRKPQMKIGKPGFIDTYTPF